MFPPLAKSNPGEDLWNGTLWWSVFLLVAILCGVVGIIEAFRRNRRRAVFAGIIAGSPAVFFFVALWLWMWLLPPSYSFDGLDVVWLGVPPLALGCLSVLLGYL